MLDWLHSMVPYVSSPMVILGIAPLIFFGIPKLVMEIRLKPRMATLKREVGNLSDWKVGSDIEDPFPELVRTGHFARRIAKQELERRREAPTNKLWVGQFVDTKAIQQCVLYYRLCQGLWIGIGSWLLLCLLTLWRTPGIWQFFIHPLVVKGEG